MTEVERRQNFSNLTTEIFPEADYFYTYCSNGKILTGSKVGDEFVKTATDFLYLVNDLDALLDLNNFYQRIGYLDRSTVELLDCIPLIPSYSSGLHSFSHCFSILQKYVTSQYGFSLLVPNQIQSWMQAIFKHLEFCHGFDPKLIIRLEPNIVYTIKNLHLIPNRIHAFTEATPLTPINEFVKNYLSLTDFIPAYIFKYKAIALIKTKGYTSDIGIFEPEDVKLFCKFNDLRPLEISSMSEIKLINILQHCEYAVFSWGTTFLKNYIYLTYNTKAKGIFVIITADFSHEYEYLRLTNTLPNFVAGCPIKYLKLSKKSNIRKLALFI